jgi:hypothetical protein
MADITKCSGQECPAKEKCYRYTANESMYQAYFAEPPIENGKCEMYWGDNAESIFNQLKEITKKQDNE